MEDDQDLDFIAPYPAPSIVSLSPFSPSVTPSPRRLSSHFSAPSPPIRSARQLCWVSLQGRLVGAEECSSAKVVGGDFSREEAVAWELFSPIHRILIVAVVAVATADMKKFRQIWKLKRSVDLRDQILSSMQQKLDDLCELLNAIKERPEIGSDMLFTNSKDFPFGEDDKLGEAVCSTCGCKACNQRNSIDKACSRDDMLKFKVSLANGAEPEERRMSDLSDWASSVTSSVDTQLNTLVIEQDIYNLQRKCEEKEGTIRELETIIYDSNVAAVKRIAELEDVIRRKSMIITKLKKDMVVLEQKVVHLTRIRRPSFSTPTPDVTQLPVMSDNILYGMDNSTSPSSSDSDSPVENQLHSPVHEDTNFVLQEDIAATRIQKSASEKILDSFPQPTEKSMNTQHVNPLNESSRNQKPNSTVTVRAMQLASGGGDVNRSRRRSQSASKDVTQQKRWV
ncbi:PREDICTED: uncharacterized protein LOC104597490 [Nelumbo nucifera]|uniref:Uncharacterized protein n=2 Tax=Nelumbo nucifera TaxID=4432 RepID=A0A822ZCM4_NELNU|nr:PREDICTED: uncharacterized protein LOC104597490 [Nelumbo nucifera]DAD42270.1 TPA_asm: hypothetical protein HUJ06_000500 [Nelumbo nucifera]